ncbi:MAG TPA: hypothetical protein VF808_10065 [Ktedonobacterales bacterium]
MSVEQFYYTSRTDPKSGAEAGSHTIYASPGLIPDEIQTLTNLSAYELPSRLNLRHPGVAPIALRYTTLSPGKAALLCCQSTGLDEKGSARSYCARAVVLEPEAFTHTPPAFYWGSSFWRAPDPLPSAPIPALDNFDPDPALDQDTIWRFLSVERRREWLPRLLSALISSAETRRRIVIVDTAENVAFWVAGMSLLLPSRYRPLLSFATYHHDPRGAGYLVTGARSDGAYHLATADFLTSFVLDTETGRVSETNDSLYAQFAASCARPDLYAERMLGLLGMCDRLFPPENVINGRLDDAAAYHARLMVNSGAIGPAARRALASAMDALTDSDSTVGERLEDLYDAYTLLLTALPESPDASLIESYEQVASLLRDVDPQGAPARLPRELWLAAQLIATNQTPEGEAVGDALLRIYGDEMVVAGLNSPAFLRELTHLSQQAPLEAATRIWNFTGKSVEASPDALPALVAMLIRTPGVEENQVTPEGIHYLESLAGATSEQAQAWLQALATETALPAPVVLAYYYALVNHLAPRERAPYRAHMREPEAAARYEIQHDLGGDSIDIQLAVLERWADYAQESVGVHPGAIAWVSIAMNHLWAITSQSHLPQIAKRSLTYPATVSQLNKRSAGVLLRMALKGIPLARPNADDLAFCKQYKHDPRLNPMERVLVIGVLAMDNGQLDRTSALELRKRFSELGPSQYLIEAHAFITRFFEQDVTREAHGEMIAATYSLQNNDAFWQSYGGALLELMIDTRTAKKAAQIIGFWFESSLSALGQFPYVVQMFFMGLPSLFEAAQKERGYREAAREIDLYCANQQWYPMVRGLIMPERKGILGLFGR